MLGERGAGRTALLDYLEHRAADCQVTRTRGLASERELTFAGLHQVCAPLLTAAGQLPEPQQQALSLAFGLQSGDQPERFVVGMAILALLSASCVDRPLVCIVDDAQWLDAASAEVLGFVARRLVTEPIAVAMVFSLEQGSVPPPGLDLSGLDTLRITGLVERDALQLLQASVVSRLDDQVVRHIVAECRGNPAQLHETSVRLQAAAAAGGYAADDHVDGQQVEQMQERLRLLPEATRQLLVLAAADPTGDAIRFWRAAHSLSLGPSAASAAVVAGLVSFDELVRFDNPLARAAIYRTGTASDRRRAHGALADATIEEANVDLRAWHRARAASHAHEETAAELERTASRARTRGGLPAEAAFRSLAADLSPDPPLRARRALKAAEVCHQAGDHASARRLLALAQAGPLNEVASARINWLLTRVTMQRRPNAEVCAMLVDAARHAQESHPSLAQAAYADAFVAAWNIEDLHVQRNASSEIAQAVLTTPATPAPMGCAGLLLQGAAVLSLEGDAAASPLIQRALLLLERQKIDDPDQLRWLALGSRLALQVWDDVRWQALTNKTLDEARRFGALPMLAGALQDVAVARLLSDGCNGALDTAQQAERVGRRHDIVSAHRGLVTVGAWSGRCLESRVSHGPVSSSRSGPSTGNPDAVAAWASAVKLNASGRYAEACEAAERGFRSAVPGFSTWCSIELIEAAVRIGEPQRAQEALKRLQGSAGSSPTQWAAGMRARCQALLETGGNAEQLYEAAISHLDQSLIRSELGRTHLLFGEWLRRQGRRTDARKHLGTAHEILLDLALDGFAERARRELVATGATVRKRSVWQADAMTPQEAQIARRAREGRTNAEIGTELFISPRTVEWHLRKVFQKLGITSRRQLNDAAFG
jgi:DNA-binding CsgD family transcriptional regulator